MRNFVLLLAAASLASAETHSLTLKQAVARALAQNPEVIMARLMQTTNAKERVYQQAVSFFSTNDSVFTALKASFTGMCPVVALLKKVAPHVVVVLGGPEVSFETHEQRICALADHVITGWGDVTFPKLAADILNGAKPALKVIAGAQPPLAEIALPYAHYTDEDIARRFIYVEASRGCPFKCEFCLSALDKTAWPFELDAFMAEIETLYQRGARNFRFVDRTFNLKVAVSERILEFFLARMDEHLFLHFELIPDHLPDKLKDTIAKFPSGALHFEIGIQTFNPDVQTRISRRQDDTQAEANIRWLREHALIHVDLIAGLPGEDLASFGRGFDRLHALQPHEIQVGILKRLRGAPIDRHTESHQLRFNPDPPYNVLATACISFSDMQRISRFARYWDLAGNSGRFQQSLPLLLGDAPFDNFMCFADWLYGETHKTHEFAFERLCEFMHVHLTRVRGVDVAVEELVEGVGATRGERVQRHRPDGPQWRRNPRESRGLDLDGMRTHGGKVQLREAPQPCCKYCFGSIQCRLQ